MKHGQERRKYIRADKPLKIRVISGDNRIFETTTKDISPVGLRFEVSGGCLSINDDIELKLDIPGVLSPVHLRAKIVWGKQLDTDDSAPFDIGCEFTKIEEDNKNTFLK